MGRRGIITTISPIIRRSRIPSFHVPLKQPPPPRVPRLDASSLLGITGLMMKSVESMTNGKKRKSFPSPLLAPPSCGSLTQIASPVSATSDEQHVVTSFYSSSGQNGPRMIRTLAGRMRGKATLIVWRTYAHDGDWPSGGVLLKSRNNRHSCRGWWKATPARHLHLPSLAFCGPSRHRRINFCILPQRESCYGIDCVRSSVTCLSPPLQTVGFFCSRGRNPSFLRGARCIWTLASDLLQLSLDPAVGLHTTLFWSGCIFGLLCCFIVGHFRMPIFCGSDP